MTNESGGKKIQTELSDSRLKAWLLKSALLPAAVAIVVLISLAVPISAPVEIKAEANLISITGVQGESSSLLPRTAVCSLDLGGFREIRIPAASIRIADAAQADRKTGAIPEEAWRVWLTAKAIGLRPSDVRFPAKVTLKTAARCRPGLKVDGFQTGTSEIVLASPEKNYLSLDLKGEQTGSVEVPEEFEIDADYCNDPIAPFPLPGPEVRLRVRLADGASSFLTFDSASSGMFAQLEFAPGHMQEAVFLNFPIQRVGFMNQDSLGKPESTVSGPGTISYFQKVVPLAAGYVLTAEELKEFRVLKLTAGTGERGLSIDMKGRAGILRSGRPSEVKDQRPTWFDALTGDPRVSAIRRAIKAVRGIFS